MHALVSSFSKTSNSTRPSDSCYFEVFENSFVHVISKFHSKPCYYVPLRNRKHFPCFYRVRESTFIMPGVGGGGEEVKMIRGAPKYFLAFSDF